MANDFFLFYHNFLDFFQIHDQDYDNHVSSYFDLFLNFFLNILKYTKSIKNTK